MDWHEIQTTPVPDDGTPVVLCLPLADDAACYCAAFVNDDGDLEALNGGEVGFPPTHWAALLPPTSTQR